MRYKKRKKLRKEVYLAVVIILIGNLLGLGLYVKERQERVLTFLPRNSYGEGGYEQNVKVQIEEEKEEIKLYVEEEQYQEEETEEYISDAIEYLEKWYKKQTNGRGELHKHIDFPEFIEKNPVLLSWYTNNPDILGWDGRIGDKVQAQGKKAELFCTIALGEEEILWKKKVMVYPPTLNTKQKLEKQIQQRAEELSRKNGKKLLLPATLEGKRIRYEKQADYKGLILCFLSIVLGIGMFPLEKEKEKRREEFRKKEMQTDYPDIVDKLVLFLQAGFSIRKAMEKLATGYLRNRERYHLGKREAYEEVVKTCREMEGGVYEAEAYERMGRRYGLSQYKMLSVLLVQNLRRGNENLLELLEREAVSVAEERKRNAKIRGEEAAIKLLLPMMMQLIVVIIILVVPAFLNFM